MKTYVRMKRFTEDFKLLEQREFRSRSFVKQMIGLLYVMSAQITSASPYSMTDITNTARNNCVNLRSEWHYMGDHLCMKACGGSGMTFFYNCQTSNTGGAIANTAFTKRNDQVGIIVGTGNTAVTPDDYKLETAVENGESAGQMQYGGCEFPQLPAFADPNGSFTIRRYFTNISGGGITVEEVGIYAIGHHSDGAYIYCVARDVVAPGVAVADTEILEVTYTFQITV